MPLRLYNEKGELVTDVGLTTLKNIETVLTEIKDTDLVGKKMDALLEAVKEITQR